MPELPEVEHAVQLLRAAIQSKVVEGLDLLHPSLRRRLPKGSARALNGARVQSVERRGKHQLVHLEDGRVMHVHFRLNGDWIIGRTTDPLPRFARAVVRFTDGTRVVLEDSRALSTIDLHAPDSPPRLDLGPEPFDEGLTASSLRAVLSGRRIPIKVALLDQRVIAGLGNIYVSEALWRARIDPRMTASALDGSQARRLLTAIRTVIERATGGRYTDQDGAQLDVYDREGQTCRRCGTRIERMTQAARSTFYCPLCQHATRVASANRAPRARRS